MCRDTVRLVCVCVCVRVCARVCVCVCVCFLGGGGVVKGIHDGSVRVFL